MSLTVYSRAKWFWSREGGEETLSYVLTRILGPNSKVSLVKRIYILVQQNLSCPKSENTTTIYGPPSPKKNRKNSTTRFNTLEYHVHMILCVCFTIDLALNVFVSWLLTFISMSSCEIQITRHVGNMRVRICTKI